MAALNVFTTSNKNDNDYANKNNFNRDRTNQTNSFKSDYDLQKGGKISSPHFNNENGGWSMNGNTLTNNQMKYWLKRWFGFQHILTEIAGKWKKGEKLSPMGASISIVHPYAPNPQNPYVPKNKQNGQFVKQATQIISNSQQSSNQPQNQVQPQSQQSNPLYYVNTAAHDEVPDPHDNSRSETYPCFYIGCPDQNVKIVDELTIVANKNGQQVKGRIKGVLDSGSLQSIIGIKAADKLLTNGWASNVDQTCSAKFVAANGNKFSCTGKHIQICVKKNENEEVDMILHTSSSIKNKYPLVGRKDMSRLDINLNSYMSNENTSVDEVIVQDFANHSQSVQTENVWFNKATDQNSTMFDVNASVGCLNKREFISASLLFKHPADANMNASSNELSIPTTEGTSMENVPGTYHHLVVP